MAKKAKRVLKGTPPKTKGKDLTKIELSVDERGRVVGNVGVEEINAFLDENLPDKKFGG